MALQTSFGLKRGTALETRSKAIKILQDYYVTKPSIKGCSSMLTGLDDDDSKALVAEVIARNPDRKVQAAAYKDMIANRERARPVSPKSSRTPKRRESIEKARRQGRS